MTRILHKESLVDVTRFGDARAADRFTAANAAESQALAREAGELTDVLDLVADIHDAAACTGSWDRVLDGIAALTGARAACLVAEYPDAGWARIVSPHIGRDLIADYRQWHDADPTATRRRAALLGQIRDLEDLAGVAPYAESEFYTQYWRRFGAGINWCSAQLLARQGVHAGIMLLPRPDQDAVADTARRHLAMLVPHLRQALDVAWRTWQLVVEKAAAAAPGPRNAPRLVVDTCGRILSASDGMAKRLTAESDLRIDGGHLVADTPETRKALAALLKPSAAQTPAKRRSKRFPLVRGNRNAHAQNIPTLIATPLYGPWPDLAGLLPHPRPAAALVLSDPASVTMERRRALREQYGLTRAEAEIATELLSGGGRPELAERLGISLTTVRTHLSRIFAKTGTNRQTELVGLVHECGY